MDPEVPVFEAETQAPEKKRRGVTFITQYGRALTFGVSQDRTKNILQAIALRKDQELTAAMQEHKRKMLNSKC